MPRDGPRVVSTDDPTGTSRPLATSGVLDFTSDLGNLAICKFSTHALNVFCLYATVSSLSVNLLCAMAILDCSLAILDCSLEILVCSLEILVCSLAMMVIIFINSANCPAIDSCSDTLNLCRNKYCSY